MALGNRDCRRRSLTGGGHHFPSVVYETELNGQLIVVPWRWCPFRALNRIKYNYYGSTNVLSAAIRFTGQGEDLRTVAGSLGAL